MGWSGRFRRGNFNRWSPILIRLRISHFTCKTFTGPLTGPMGHNNGWFQTWFLRNSKNKNFLLFSLWICEKFQNFLLGYLPLKWKFSKNSFFIEFRIKFWFGKLSFQKFLIYDSMFYFWNIFNIDGLTFPPYFVAITGYSTANNNRKFVFCTVLYRFKSELYFQSKNSDCL